MAEIKSINNMPLCDETARDNIERIAGLLDHYVTKPEFDEAIANIEPEEVDLSSYATTTYVDEAIANIEPEEVDLSNYATKDDLDTKADAEHTHDEYLTEVPDEYITEDELDERGYAKITYVDEAIANIEPEEVDLSNYATKDDLETKADADHTHDEYVTKENPTMTGYLSLGRAENSTIGENSVAIGYNATASSPYTHAEGFYTKAEGHCSHAEGANTQAVGDISHAEGSSTIANGVYSHTEGYNTIASGDYQHVQGKYNISDTENKYAHIVGNGDENTLTRSNAHTLDWSGNAWFAGNVTIGADNKELATIDHTHDEYLTSIPDEYVTEEELESKGYLTEHQSLEGYATKTYVNTAVADAFSDIDNIEYITKENPTMTGYMSLNRKTSTTIGDYSVALGISTTASDYASFAEGYETKASNYCSHAEGFGTTASGDCSHAEGHETKANGNYSHAEGYYTVAKGKYQHVQGIYNIEDTETYAHIVGNGIGDESRSNAHTLDWDGNAWFAGSITIGADNTKIATQTYVNNAIDDIDLSGYATETYVTNKITEAQLGGGEVDLSNYATVDHTHDEYITEDELDSKGYATTTYVEEVLGDIESLLGNI